MQLRSHFMRPFGRTGLAAGMSIIEIIIVVALIGTLMAYIVRNLMTTSENAKKDQTKIAMGMLSQDLQLFRVHCSKYPTTEQGLQALLVAPGDLKCWRGPYTEENKIKDPWGAEFSYESDGRQYKIMSGSIDGQMGTEDDITYPEAPGNAGSGG